MAETALERQLLRPIIPCRFRAAVFAAINSQQLLAGGLRNNAAIRSMEMSIYKCSRIVSFEHAGKAATRSFLQEMSGDMQEVRGSYPAVHESPCTVTRRTSPTRTSGVTLQTCTCDVMPAQVPRRPIWTQNWRREGYGLG